MLNALQANPADPKIGVRSHADSSGNGLQGLQIEVQDNGAGFTPEAAQKAPAPFFTTRNVGLGLGLTVSRKIIETHRGKLEILAPKSGQAGRGADFPAPGPVPDAASLREGRGQPPVNAIAASHCRPPPAVNVSQASSPAMRAASRLQVPRSAGRDAGPLAGEDAPLAPPIFPLVARRVSCRMRSRGTCQSQRAV